MTSTCKVYKDRIEIGEGTCAAGSATISSFVKIVETTNDPSPTTTRRRQAYRKNCEITVTEAGTHKGRTWSARVIADSGFPGDGNLTLNQPCPFIGA